MEKVYQSILSWIILSTQVNCTTPQNWSCELRIVIIDKFVQSVWNCELCACEVFKVCLIRLDWFTVHFFSELCHIDQVIGIDCVCTGCAAFLCTPCIYQVFMHEKSQYLKYAFKCYCWLYAFHKSSQELQGCAVYVNALTAGLFMWLSRLMMFGHMLDGWYDNCSCCLCTDLLMVFLP